MSQKKRMHLVDHLLPQVASVRTMHGVQFLNPLDALSKLVMRPSSLKPEAMEVHTVANGAEDISKINRHRVMFDTHLGAMRKLMAIPSAKECMPPYGIGMTSLGVLP